MQPKIIIDKLSVTLAIPPYYRAVVQENIEKKVDEKRLTRTIRDDRYGYRNHYKLNSSKSNNNYVLLSTHPTGNRNWMRLEFNPSRFNPDELNTLGSRLNILLGQPLPTWLKKSRITRIDLAVDLAGLSMNHVLGHTSMSGMQKVKLTYGTGGLETLEFGSDRGRVKMRIYDKLKELKKRKQPLPTSSLVRFELQLRDLGKSMAELRGIENHFSRLVFYHETIVDEDLHPLFFPAVESRGLAAASKSLEPNEARRLRYRLRKHQVDPLQVRKVWATFEQAVTTLRTWSQAGKS